MTGFKTSVVTGGSGFIGSHLVDLLLEKGHNVELLIFALYVEPKIAA
jgi:nucleoside-diphosphate-sugar epimerase